MKNTLISAGVAVLVVVLGFVFVPRVVNNTYGAVPGGDFTNQVNFMGGVVNSGVVATSSVSTAVTVAAADLTSWANASLVSYTPNRSALTLTLPASSTMPSLVPKAGDSQRFCMKNATSTAGTVITFAGGTGTSFNVASSSATAVGSSVLRTGEVGCFTLIREVATSAAFDISVLYTVFQ